MNLFAGSTVSDDAPTELPAGGPNSISKGLGVLGDEWSMQVLRAAHTGATRFGQFQERLPISASSLTARLTTLSQEGLLGRRIYQDRPVRADYVLTARGRATWPILLSVWDWERAWRPGATGDLPAMQHTACGRQFRPTLVCATCGEHADRHTTRGIWGPNGGWDRSVPEVTTRRRPVGHADTGQFPETMAVFGNRWSAAVVGAAFQGVRRYSEFESALTIPPNLLAERLRVLLEHHFLRTETTADGRSHYELTAKGAAFFPIIALTLHWAENWYTSPGGPAMRWQHNDHHFRPRLDCGHCATPLTAAQIDVVNGTL
ncbi:putative HxlR family transcriptional regulator [Gordonia hirsuta DSM 44140 = NBRC 16056]|uniref:Putative HxlR family transcriptional regulator n=1 Tax=Gordonia hirsuta DSM 44140 = NBRC 16056 TaxID=1121927 RepID=L7L981_9ACTN|nr:helix-turn-helix domain-containing protein [Gordonia hirsuta]GAC56583.1 putative HxlR family transcriptional regulator [Gordonia hirsuta DSM 44140 = NBRC 16056]